MSRYKQKRYSILSRISEFRQMTLYLRNARSNDIIESLAELSYPIDVRGLIEQKFEITSDYPHEMNGVIQADQITHIVTIYKSVDLAMLNYDTPPAYLPNRQKRNILVFTDYSSVVEPNGIQNVYKILNPDIIQDPTEPNFKRLHCIFQGRIDEGGSIRF